MRFDERISSFSQVGEGLPSSITLDANKKGAVRRNGRYRFVTTSTALYVRFGDKDVTCATDGSEGYLLVPNTVHFIEAPKAIKDGVSVTHVAFSRAIVPATDNFAEVR